MTRPDYWLTKFSNLRVDRARGDPAPHKRLLLLVLCDLAESGDLREALSLSRAIYSLEKGDESVVLSLWLACREIAN